ncbi:MAG: hypothetical protein SF123_06180 [Chloroflexota bacterium]|nr:hypothetical protein [Chloroflexota bacterium]
MSMRIYLLLALVLLFAAACSTPPELRDNTLLNDSSLLTPAPTLAPTPTLDPAAEAAPTLSTDASDATPTLDPLTDAITIDEDAVCAPPCWRGITPGVTTWADALNVISNDSTLQNLEIQSSEDSTARGASFRGVGSEVTCCQIYSSEGSTVDLVALQVAPTTTIGQVIEIWGEPDYALGTPFSDGQAVLNLIYEDVPMVVFVFVAGESGSVTTTSEIVAVWYMAPTEMNTLITNNALHRWEGYDTFSAYDAEAGTFDTTPVPTATPTP